MKVNMVTAKPADGGPVRCLLVSEQADGVIDFFAALREAKGVHPETGEKFTQIALFQRPKTTKRSTFHENEQAAGEEAAPEKTVKPAAKSKAAKPSTPPGSSSVTTQNGGEDEETGI